MKKHVGFRKGKEPIDRTFVLKSIVETYMNGKINLFDAVLYINKALNNVNESNFEISY